jgi:hypothetical protein
LQLNAIRKRGRLGCESEEGRASIFHLQLPFGLDRPPPPARPVTSRHAGSPRILVAEDNPVNRKVVLSPLDRTGCAVETVVNGREVLEILEREEFDLILMDAQMPEMDRLEVQVAPVPVG